MAGMGYSVARLAVAAGAKVHATDLSRWFEKLAQDGIITALWMSQNRQMLRPLQTNLILMEL